MKPNSRTGLTWLVATLVALAAAHPERNFVGLEVHPPGVGHLLLQCEAARLANEAAGISVSRFGPATVSVDELLKAVAAAEGAAS